MSGKKAKGGRKNRKYGRWGRSPSMRRYIAENRFETNKARRIAKHEREVEKKANR